MPPSSERLRQRPRRIEVTPSVVVVPVAEGFTCTVASAAQDSVVVHSSTDSGPKHQDGGLANQSQLGKKNSNLDWLKALGSSEKASGRQFSGRVAA